MNQLIVHHKVEDFAKWKQTFDEHSETRVRNGSKAYRLFRKTDDPNEVFIVFDWENEKKARAFTESQELKEIMQKAGVISEPEIYFLQEIEARPEGFGEEELKWTA